MSEAILVDALRHSLLELVFVAAPVLVAAFAVGAFTGFLQAATGIHETVVGLLPRLVVVGLVLAVTLPWMLERLVVLLRAAAAGG